MRGGLGAHRLGSNRPRNPSNDVVVYAVLHARVAVFQSEQAFDIGFVFGEEQFRRAVIIEPAFAQARVIEFNRAGNLAQVRVGRISTPGVAKPDGWQQT